MVQKKASKIAPCPQIILTDQTPSLEFGVNEAIKLELNVKVLNLDLSKCDVTIICKSSFGLGHIATKSKTEQDFKEGLLVIHAVNNCCGGTLTIQLIVCEKSAGLLNTYPFIERIAEAEIILKPTCKKKVGAVVWDLKDNVASNVSLGSPIADVDIELFGYNGEELLLIKNIVEKGKVVFEKTTIVQVRKNSLKTCFYKSDCLTQEPGSEATLTIQLFYKGEQLVFEDNTKTQKRDIKLQEYMGVEPITSFPSQPVVTGTNEVIDKTFRPNEQIADKEKAAQQEDSNLTEQKESTPPMSNKSAVWIPVLEEEKESNDGNISIDIIDTTNGDVKIQSNFEQFINLPREPSFSDNPKKNDLYTLGNDVDYKVTLQGNIQGKFKVYLIAQEGNVTYSEKEKARNSAYKYKHNCKALLDATSKPVLISNGSKHKLEDDEKVLLQTITKSNKGVLEEFGTLSLTPSGGNKYYLLIEGCEKEAISTQITTRRKFFYLEVKMEEENSNAILSNIPDDTSFFVNEFKKHSIILEKLQTPITIPHVKNLGIGSVLDGNTTILERTKFLKDTLKGYKIDDDISPYCITILYVNNLAFKESDIVTFVYGAIVNSKKDSIIVDIAYDSSLWVNMDNLDDWFVDCEFKDEYDNIIKIGKDLIEPVFDVVVDDVGYNAEAVRINVKGLKDGMYDIKLTVNTIGGMSGGYTQDEYKVIVIATKTWLGLKDETSICQIVIHELGHQLDMLPEGPDFDWTGYPQKPTYKGLDQLKNYYIEHGHFGPHCGFGLTKAERKLANYNDVERLLGCVMFGSSNNLKVFCKDCAVCLRKSIISLNR